MLSGCRDNHTGESLCVGGTEIRRADVIVAIKRAHPSEGISVTNGAVYVSNSDTSHLVDCGTVLLPVLLDIMQYNAEKQTTLSFERTVLQIKSSCDIWTMNTPYYGLEAVISYAFVSMVQRGWNCEVN